VDTIALYQIYVGNKGFLLILFYLDYVCHFKGSNICLITWLLMIV